MNDFFNVTNIIDIVIKCIIIIFTQITCYKIINDNKYITISKCVGYATSIILSILMKFIEYKTDLFCSTIVLVFLMSFIFLFISKKKIGYSLILTIISLAINYVIYFISLIIAFLITNGIGNKKNDSVNVLIIVICNMIILILGFKNKKIKYGIISLQNNLNNEYIELLILTISVGILFIGIIFSNKIIVSINNYFCIFIILGILMLITIQKSLQLYYKQQMLIKDLKETKEELEKKNKEIQKLENENIEISKKRHTIVHKQKSLERKLEEIIMKSEISTEEAVKVKVRLEKLNSEIYNKKEVIELDKTGIENIDDMLKYMQIECIKNKIDFTLKITGNIYYMINNLINKEDLETLLADHIKDAIIAINHTENINKSILVRLGDIDGNYGLYIYDSGVEFPKEVLENLGKKPCTTYKNEGGTGMGFMNTFDTLRKCNASLIIEELNEPKEDNYTKIVEIKFDKKNEFKVNSYKNKNR